MIFTYDLHAFIRLAFITIITLSISLFSSCSLFSVESPGLQSTLIALYVRQTGLAQSFQSMTQIADQNALSTPISADYLVTPSPEFDANQGTPTPIDPSMTDPPMIVEDPDDRLLKSARILLFEDMSASRHIRYVKEALDREGYFYQDVGSAKGWFKTMLLSGVEWDLVIAAAEARRDFGGELFEFIDDRVANGAGAIIEYWDLDSAPMGKVKPLLDRCGVTFQSDWYEPDMRVFFWLMPDHPVLHQPNQIPNNLRNVEPLWPGDIGDLLEIKYQGGEQMGDAEILAGTSPLWKTDHATLISCLGGRMIWQSFNSHEYQMEDVVNLWQNYIYQSLKSHFAYTGATIPTPAITAGPSSEETPTPLGPTPGSEYTLDYNCDGLITTRLMDAPLFQVDLFEHHARGTFLILKLELMNETDFPIQIWDEDYFIEGNIEGKQVVYSPHRAATGFLFIENGYNLYQDLLEPGTSWRTSLAFDVDPEGDDWILIVKPGSEYNEQVCEVRIPLTK